MRERERERMRCSERERERESKRERMRETKCADISIKENPKVVVKHAVSQKAMISDIS